MYQINKTHPISYIKDIKKKYIIIFISILLLFLFILVSICIGPAKIAIHDIINFNTRTATIIWMLRLPRIITGCLVGVGLGISGCILQSILKNPLASPYTLGIGSGAGFGAVLMIMLFGGYNKDMVVLGSFGFSILSTLFIISIAKLKDDSTETLILAGIAQMFLYSSLISFFQYIGTTDQVHEIVFWFFGSLAKPGWREISIASLMILLPIPFFIYHFYDFDILTEGDEIAQSFGVDVKKIRFFSIVLTSIIISASICFTGIIGFVGLVAPHITRMCIGNDHKFLILGSAINGAIIVIIADMLGQIICAPAVMPIGIMTSFIGVPFFMYLLIKRKKTYW